MCYIFSLTFKYKFLDSKYKHISGREHDWKRLVKTQMLWSVKHFNRPTHFLLMRYPLLSILFLYGKRKWRSSFFFRVKRDVAMFWLFTFIICTSVWKNFRDKKATCTSICSLNFTLSTINYEPYINYVPKGNISMSLNIKAKLAQRAAHHRDRRNGWNRQG